MKCDVLFLSYLSSDSVFMMYPIHDQVLLNYV